MKPLFSIALLLLTPAFLADAAPENPVRREVTPAQQLALMPEIDLAPVTENTVNSRAVSSSADSTAQQPQFSFSNNLTFDFSDKTPVSNQYQTEGVIFSTGAQAREDAVNIDSPVLTGTPAFRGDIEAIFVDPGTGSPLPVYMAVFDIGYLDAIGTTKMQFFGPQGQLLYEYNNSITGFLRYSAYGGNIGISRIRFSAASSEPEGFGIDNLAFTTPGAKDLGREMGIAVCALGNPINPAAGNKYQVETDYHSNKPFPLEVTRTYNSINGTWQFFPALDHTSGRVESRIVRADGKRLTYASYGATGWVPSSPDIKGSLATLPDGKFTGIAWQYTTEDDQVELYDVAGRILSVSNRAGISHTYEYGESEITLSHSLGGSIVYDIDLNGRINGFTDPEGNTYRYTYSASGLINSVSYPEEGGSRIYHYEDATHPDLLTGITDANGDRYASWAYDANRRAISSQHSGGVERLTFDYSNADHPLYPITRTTNALGKETTFRHVYVNGVRKVYRVEGHASDNCVAANQNYGYNGRAFLASKTDWKGNVTSYVRNAKGQELERTEAQGTPNQRVVFTEWHSQFNLPVRIEEPGKTTSYDYDANGNLLSKKIEDNTAP